MTRIASSLLGLAVLSIPAFGQFSDNFDSYAAGTAIEGQGSWFNWSGGSQPYNTVESTFASSGANSVAIRGSGTTTCQYCADTVSQLGGPYLSGQWTFKCKQYIPSSFGGTTYWIMMNTFSTAGPWSWSVQVPFNASTAMVTVDANSSSTLSGPNSYPIVFDQWVELKAEIDLDNDHAWIFYDGQLLHEFVWSIGVSISGVPQLSALDLFAGDYNVTEVYYDDVQVTAGISAGTNLYCSPANNNSTGAPVTLASSSSGGAALFHLEATGGPLDQFGMFIVSATPIDPGIPISQGRLCLIAPLGRYNSVAGPGLNSIGRFNASGVLQNLFGTSSTGTGFDVPAVLPSPPGGTITAGSTWNFQLWYRDGAFSNFSDALAVTF